MLPLLFAISSARADFMLGDAANYAVLFEGVGGNALQFNNGTISGNIGIAATGQLQLSGGAANTIINGNVLFNGAVSKQGTAGTDYTQTAGHTITGNNSSVQAAMNAMNTLSSTLGAEQGNALTVNVGNGATQTIDVSSGKQDASGNYVFTLSSNFHFVNGATLVIDGDSLGHSVVFNMNFAPSFGGRILLTGGLTSDQVLFNVIGGANLTGGNTLTISTNGATETGTFLDPNGTIQINHSVLDGRLFGGDTHNFAVVSGANIFAPPTPTPVPGSFTMLAICAGVAVGAQGARRLARHRAAARQSFSSAG